MALSFARQPLPYRQNFRRASTTLSMYLHKNRMYVVANRRCSSRCPNPPEPREKDPCPGKTACPKEPSKKKGFWRRLFAPEPEQRPEPPRDPSCCKKRYEEREDRADPDLSGFGGEPYKTCGDAYLIQKALLCADREREPTREDQQLRRIEADHEMKDTVNEDPVGGFRSTELRLLELTDKRLHPLYKKYGGVKRRYLEEQRKRLYKTVSWPIDMHEIPARLNINSDVVERKNMEYMEFKRIEPPRQLVGRIVEMEANARPTLEGKKGAPVDLREVERRQNAEVSKPVFDTLGLQRGTKY